MMTTGYKRSRRMMRQQKAGEAKMAAVWKVDRQ